MELFNFTYKNTCPPEKVSEAAEWLDNLDPNEAVSNANFAIFYKKADYQQHLSKICHALVQGPLPSSDERECLALYINNGDWAPDPNREYYRHWLLRESFVKNFILHESTNGVVLSADIPADFMQNVCILIRHIAELPESNFRLFKHIVDLGYSEYVAYVIAFNSTVPLSISGESNHPFRCKRASHRAWHLFDVPAFRNFLKMVSPDYCCKYNYRHTSRMYGGIRYCWGRGSGHKQGISFFTSDLYTEDHEYKTGLINFRRKPADDVYRPPNPFKKIPIGTSPLKEDEVTYSELLNYVLPYCKKKGIFDV